MEKTVYIDGLKTDYSITSDGVLYSLKHGRKISLSYNNINGGYKMCYMYINGKRYDRLIHRIVGSAFIPNPDNKPQINHKDGDKDNNNVSNLEWVTQSENIKHAYANKLMTKSYKDCYNSLLDESQVRQIRIKISNGNKQRNIADEFNVSEQLISSIKHNRNYKGVGEI